ncbi:hypothetical protein [Streptomyces roseolilacinus]|jgi:hypothetical protein|uniref:hypothetical protein n=1 Tax=Streptomyces roseolilacinus TaxID=66904 RepID=UPI0038192F56
MTSSRACAISEDDLKLLTLLVTYPSDDPIARHLDVSVRTVRRRIARIMELLGVQNRFAAGVAAAQLGWVSCAPTAHRPGGVRVFSTLPGPSDRAVISVGTRS